MATVEITMPKMGESITEGTVIAWHKQPGEAVELDETLLEIGTDKVDTEVPSPAAGVLKAILVEEGATVDVGTAIAVIETEAEAVVEAEPVAAPPAEAAPEPEAVAEPEPEAAPQVEPAPVAAPAGAGEIEVVMPKMGESITEGTVIAWHKQPGEAVELDETLLEIGTDKVDTEVPSPAAGVLKAILVEEGATVDVGTAIAVIETDAEAGAVVQPVPQPAAPDATPVPSGDGAQRQPVAEAQAVSQPTGDGAVAAPRPEEAGEIARHSADGRFLSPLVRSIARAEGLSMRELETITGSGREGRLTKKDILGYLEQRSLPQTAPAPARPASVPRPSQPMPVVVSGDGGERVEIIEMDRMRQLIAQHMRASKSTSAHVTSFAEADVTNLVRLREANKKAFLDRAGVKLTYTPFFVYAAVEALREHPILNASVDGTRILLKKDYHIGIAVAIEKSGLIVPVIRHAGRQRVAGLAHAANDLAHRARTKQLQPDDLQGGTFTVTNVGSLGSIMGTPIILQPQVAILATGAIKKRPVVIEDPDLGDIIAIRHMMYLSLSYDHRIIDGAMGVSFLRKFVDVIEGLDPAMEV